MPHVDTTHTGSADGDTGTDAVNRHRDRGSSTNGSAQWARVTERGRRIVTAMMGRRSDWRLDRVPHLGVPRPGRHWVGPVIAIGSILIGWFAFDDTIGDDNVGFALFIGSASIVMMAWSFFLALRLQANEALFGGLDRA